MRLYGVIFFKYNDAIIFAHEEHKSVQNAYVERLERISMHIGNACPIKSQIIPVAITVGIRLSPEEQVRVIASLYRRMFSMYVCVSVYAGACVVYDGIPKSTIPHTKNLKNSKFIAFKNIESSNGLYKIHQLFSQRKEYSLLIIYYLTENHLHKCRFDIKIIVLK